MNSRSRESKRDSAPRKILGVFVSLAVLCSIFLAVIPASAANPSANLDQCANDPAPSPPTDGCNSSATQWVNGNLGASKSVYREGDSIPYRLTFDNLSLASHTVTIEWDTTKSGHHAIDYITTFNQSVLDANACLGVSACGSPTTFPIPADPQVTAAGVTPIAGNFTIYGGTITAVSAYSYPNGAGFAGDKSAQITITFTATQANPVLAWGGHIATRTDWGIGNSAVAIPGSPYHSRLIDLDGSGGNQDRSLSAAAVVFPATITIIKDDVTPATDPQTFPFSASGAEMIPTSFSLADDGVAGHDTTTFGGLVTFPSTRTVTEGTLPLNWTFTGFISCSVSGGGGTPGTVTTDVGTRTATFDLNEANNATCTFQNSRQATNLSITKVADAASVNAGEQIGFTITVSNAGPGTATGVALSDSLPPGTGVDWGIASQSGGASCSITGSPPSETLNCGGSSFNLASGANFSVHVTSGTTSASCKKYDNTATFSSNNGGSGNASDSTTVNCPNITITKTADNATVNAGEDIGFKVTVTNSGAGTAKGVEINDLLPAGSGVNWALDAGGSDPTCSVTGLPPAQTLHCGPVSLTTGQSLVAHVTSGTTATSCGTYDNTASFTSTNDGTGDASASTTVNCGNISITKVADNTPVNAGDQIGFTITVSNAGPGTAKGVTMIDTLPTNAGLSWSIATTSGGWTCAIAGGVLTCGGSGFNLVSGGSASVHITSPTTSATCGTVNNVASVTTSNDGSDSAFATITVNCPHVSQITPTATTCDQFRTGTAATLSILNYTVKNGLVSAVSPGVFFYWVKLDNVTAGSHTFTINQTITTGNFDSHFFNQASGSFVWSSTCAKQAANISTSNGVTTITFNASSAGTYFIGVKYDSKSVEGFAAPIPSTVHYDFSTAGVPNSTDGLDLVKK